MTTLQELHNLKQAKLSAMAQAQIEAELPHKELQEIERAIEQAHAEAHRRDAQRKAGDYRALTDSAQSSITEMATFLGNVANTLLHAPIQPLHDAFNAQRLIEQDIIDQAMVTPVAGERPLSDNATLNDDDLVAWKHNQRLRVAEARKALNALQPSMPLQVALATWVMGAPTYQERIIRIGLSYAITGELINPHSNYDANEASRLFMVQVPRVY